MILLVDDETRTYWDHISGKALHGQLKGVKLDLRPVEMTTVGSALELNPDMRLHLSKLSLSARFFNILNRFMRGFLPPGFRRTMGEPDRRLPEMTMGLGVIADDVQRFYPVKLIGDGVEDDINGRSVYVRFSADRVPFAVWSDESRPMQLFTRWYGFSYTFPGCEIYGDDGH